MAKRKSKKRVFLTISFLVILLLVITLIFALRAKDESIKVTTTKVERRTIVQSVSAVGRIQPEIQVKISSETSGEIIYLGVREGDTVRQGEILVRIKPDIFETQLEQFKSAAEAAKLETEVLHTEKVRAENELKRATELYKKEFVSKQDFENAKAAFERAVSSYNAGLSRYEQAVAAYRQMQRSFERTTIKAPINGIVTSLTVEKGEKVVGTAQMSGTEIMQIADLSIMNAIVEVDENDIVNVKVGDTADIEVDAIPDEIFKGVVVETGHSAVVSKFGTQDEVVNFKVKIRFLQPDFRLRPGMSCNVEIKTQRRENVLAVPLQCVTVRLDAGKQKSTDVVSNEVEKSSNQEKQKKSSIPSVVFLNDKGKAKMVQVKTGISDKGYIEITEGLEEGQEVISGSFMAITKLLKDGSPIKVDTSKISFTD
ncbi:MAG: efflux RND transporter periplasmic adaptor subunit [Ignavibacteria bacterium]|nr:efflux RND transporter periplasmic adaptor subunit [Ignavibacteria bacterium]